MAARRDTVQSVERGLDLIDALAGGEQLGVSELAAGVGLAPSTVHRLLATLTKRGYVMHDAVTGRYALGYKVIGLANRLEHSAARLRGAARPHLEAIQGVTGESANLTVLQGDKVVYLDQVEGSRSVRMFTTIGATALAHTTGSGKAMLAHQPPAVLDSLYPEGATLQRLTPRTLTSVEELKRDLERIVERGFGVDNEEHEEGVSCIAVPLFADDRACAAISVSGPTARIVTGDTGALGDLLRRHAAEISPTLGRRRPPADEAIPSAAAPGGLAAVPD